MTLAVVWRSEGRLHMASDSRMSFGRAGHADVGVKVMRLPIKVLGTELDANGHTSVLFRRTYGLCFAGSFTNAGTFKALIEDLLVDVQYVNADVRLSFDGLCRFVRHFSEKVSTEVVATLVEHGRYTFCIAGVCPEQDRLRAARFHLVQVHGRTEASFEEIAAEDRRRLLWLWRSKVPNDPWRARRDEVQRFADPQSGHRGADCGHGRWGHPVRKLR